MEPEDNSGKALISGIISDAESEADKIIQDAQRQADERKKYAAKEAESILREAEEKARVQSEAVKRHILSGVDIEVRRKSMQVKERVLSEVITRVKDEFKKMVGSSEYREVLIEWITEAMIGLGAERAEVNTSAEEKKIINAGLLSIAEKKVQESTGTRVKVTMSKGKALVSQGVVLTSADGKTAFNNQVATRLLRKQRAIRALIYERLFNEQ